ncbi:MAG: malate dehydrogenase (quinone) [Puniceicoccaceae bacterium]|nr:malate dehydrogenase (quinone) [Puniceicoccaceae bacterium]
MIKDQHIKDPDVILIGSGIISATLGVVLKQLDPSITIQLYEASEHLSSEASNAWHNAGTGHAGLCELSYTPNYGEDGDVDVSKAIEIFQQFEHSLQLWAYAATKGIIKNTKNCINLIPHLSLAYGQEQVDFLSSRYRKMSQHHFFKDMEFTQDRDTIRQWAPLILEGRGQEPVAMTRVSQGTDVNFGAIASQMIEWLREQEGCGSVTQHRVTNLSEMDDGWKVEISNLYEGTKFTNTAAFVFIGAGGGSLPLLQNSGIDEAKGLGGFPIGGQWLVSKNPKLVNQHTAKIYGMSPGAAPTMAVPHLDTRIIDGEKSLLFGPYAAWTTKFLHAQGSYFDLPNSIRSDNIISLIKVGIQNFPLVRYLIQQGSQSMNTRLKELKNFYPDACHKDWQLIDAGIRVQAIKKEDGDAGIVHFGTEVITNSNKNLSALLGASPGASVSTSIIIDILKECFAEKLKNAHCKENLLKMIPTYNEDLSMPHMAERQLQINKQSMRSLNLV